MKRNRIRFAALCLSLLFLIPSCGKKEKQTEPQTAAVTAAGTGAVTEDGFLTCIFSQTDAVLPGEYSMLFSVVPYCDPETGNVTFAAMERIREETGEPEFITKIALFTYSEDGKLVEKTETSLAVSAAALRGVVTSDALCIDYGTNDNVALYRWDRKTGEVRSVGEGTVFFGRNGFNIDVVAADAEGRIFCSDRESVIVLSPALDLIADFDLPSPVSSMARGGDGTVWAIYRGGGSVHAARIDPESGGFGTEYLFTGIGGLRNLVNAVLPMEYDFCFYDDNAVWGARGGEDGIVRTEPIADFLNSGIPELSGLNDYMGGKESLFASAVYGEDAMLAGSGSDLSKVTPVFLRRAPDVDPADLKTVVFAHAYPLKPNIVAKIRTFPRLHPDTRIEVHDYSVYCTPEDYGAGEEKLAFDILNAGFRPDVVVTQAKTFGPYTVSDRSLVPQMLRRGLLRDLTPWLEKDDYVNFGNLFGCVRRLFDDGNGGMWGISTAMEAETLMVSPVWKNRLAEILPGKTSWTLGEMLDFFESLPEGQEAFFSANRKDAQMEWVMLGGGYSVFFDGDGNLDTDLLLRYLAFLEPLPEDRPAWSRIRGSNEVIPQQVMMNGEAAVMKANNQAIGFLVLSYLRMGCVMMGFPRDAVESGIRIDGDLAYSVTSYAEDPDACFDLIRSFFTMDGIRHYIEYSGADVPFFTLKPLYEEVQYAKRWDGSYVWDPPTPEELAWVYDLLDHAGMPWLESTPDELGVICREEISAYFGGLGTAGECADKIRSRAGIWMAERR